MWFLLLQKRWCSLPEMNASQLRVVASLSKFMGGFILATMEKNRISCLLAQELGRNFSSIINISFL